MKTTDSKKDYGNEKKFADVDIWVLSSINRF